MQLVRVLVLSLLIALLPAQAEVIHEGTGPRMDAGGNINNLSGIVYAPQYQRFIGIRQNNMAYVYNPATIAGGEEFTTYLSGCPGGDKESITMIDPWGLRGFGDIVMVMDEDEHTICTYSVEGILSGQRQVALQVWDLDTILDITYNYSEGLLFIPDDEDCIDTLYGGCFVVNLNQRGRTLHKFQILQDGSLEAVGATFKVDEPCGWTGGSLQDLNYDWFNERVYALITTHGKSCVLSKDMTQYIGVVPCPIHWKFEGFAWGSGLVVWANDNDAFTGQMISFQEDLYTVFEPLCYRNYECDGYCDYEQCFMCSGGGRNRRPKNQTRPYGNGHLRGN